MSKPGFFAYLVLTIGVVVGLILVFAGGVDAMITTIPGIAIIVASLGIEGSFVRALKAMSPGGLR